MLRVTESIPRVTAINIRGIHHPVFLHGAFRPRFPTLQHRGATRLIPLTLATKLNGDGVITALDSSLR